MTEQSPTGEEFVNRWFEERGEEDRLDPEILSLIDEHRTGSKLSEDRLLSDLTAISEGEAQENAES